MFAFNPFRRPDYWLDAVNEAALDEAISQDRKFHFVLFYPNGKVLHWTSVP